MRHRFVSHLLEGMFPTFTYISCTIGLIWGLKQPLYSAITLKIWVFTEGGPKEVRISHHHKSDLTAHFLF